MPYQQGAIITVNATAKGITTDSADVSTGAVVITTKQGTGVLQAAKIALPVNILLADTVFQIAQKTVLVVDTPLDFDGLIIGGNIARVTDAKPRYSN